MIPIEGRPVLTAAQMKAAEERSGVSPQELMERAGKGVAEAVRRLAAGAEVLILCGPGNNGGDGYVAARVLRENGHPVRVAALTPPRTALARKAAAAWEGPTDIYTTGNQTRIDQPAWRKRAPVAAPLLVDALFGTGGREAYAQEPWVAAHRYLFEQARQKVAVDLPLGLSADGEHRPPGEFAFADVTLALGALKPAHLRASVDDFCGEVRVIDLGLGLEDARVRAIDRPTLLQPGVWTHKYTRGMVGVVSGAMPGAALLAATSAARAGAGYVALYGKATGGPNALVHKPLTEEALSDPRLNVVVVGPGLGRDDHARHWVEWLVRNTHHHLVVDGDALRLLDPSWLSNRNLGVVLTPHAGERKALNARAPAAPDATNDPFNACIAEVKALASGPHVMVAKGPTTIVADDREARVASRGNPWLSTAGTGDVLAGAIAASIASGRHRGNPPLIDMVAAGVWLHADAARRCGASFIADDLAYALTAARASL